MKRTEPRNIKIGNRNFYIYPFSAFKAANLSGELLKILGPSLGSFAPLAVSNENNGKSVFDYDVKELAPAISGAFATLSGDAVEALLRKLLIANENIAYENSEGKALRLTEDDIDEIFCGEVQGMYLLAFEVIRTNYGGFFEKFGSLFGRASESSTTETAQVSTDTSIPNNSAP